MNRRESLKYMAHLLWIPLAWLVVKLDDSHRKSGIASPLVRINKDLPEGISFHDTVIASKHHHTIRFLSSGCSHLGCRIQKEELGVLVCPCHGSRFDSEGQNLQGPAVKPLKTLSYRLDAKTGDYLVKTAEF